jgi:adenine-specific DNA-methyltransferase
VASRGLYLQWEGKRLYRQRVPTPRLLEPVPKLSVGEGSQNMIIEGDCLQVLASLKSRYAGEVDVIYIDPPYNLGKDDFRYSDKRFYDPDADDSDAVYVTNEDAGRHTKWLNFMAPRLYMLWEILNDSRGVIFVSINDVELFRLGLLLNEIFGEENWVGTIVWHGATDNNPAKIALEHEYILCYAKNKAQLPSSWSSPDSEVKTFMLNAYSQFKTELSSLKEIKRKFLEFAKEHKDYLGDLYRYRKIDERGPYVTRRNLDKPDQHGYRYDVIHPKTKLPCRMPPGGWRYPPERMKELIKVENRIVFGKDETQIPQIKFYLEEVQFKLRSVIEDIDARAGANELFNLTESRYEFRSPKPVELIERILSYSTNRNSLILDAFAGSGTTAQAVLKLNNRDQGNRRFILVEEGRGRNGKDKFARTLTAGRVKSAIQHYQYNDGFTFYETGRKLDRQAIVGLKRDALANLICQADETGRGKSITRLSGYKYVIGKNPRNEAICLVWNGEEDSEVTSEDLRSAAEEVTAAELKRPFRIYGTFCRVADTATSWKFCQIPDEILTQMHILEDLGEDEE